MKEGCFNLASACPNSAQINLNSQFARISEAVKAKNVGDKPVSDVVFCQLLNGDAVVSLYKVSRTIPLA